MKEEDLAQDHMWITSRQEPPALAKDGGGCEEETENEENIRY